MAIIPNDEKVFMVDKTTNTTFSGSRATKAMQQWYTMNDVIETINSQPVSGTNATATVVGGIVRDFTVTPLFSYLANSYNYDYPVVGLTYPNEIPTLKSFTAGIILNSYGTPIEVTINGIEAFVLNTAGLNISAGGFATTQKITFEDLIYVYGGFSSTALVTSSTLTSISMPNLEFWWGTMGFSNSSPISSFNFPKLKVLGANLTNNNVALQTVILPELVQGGYSDVLNSSIQSINLPKLKVLNGLTLTGTKASLTSIQLPVIEYCPAITFPTTSASLSTFTFGNSLKFYGSSNTAGNFVTTSNSLDQTSVDNILVSLAALDGTNGTTAFSNRTVTITGTSATPSATGLAAKATLVSRGCTVTTN